MNPYDFVPIDLNNSPHRCAPITHEKFGDNCLSGNLKCTIIAETPLFIKMGDSSNFTKNRSGDFIIPGTSLKGLFRSLVETLGPGCFSKFDGRYKDRQRGWVDHKNKLPKSFKSCTEVADLCIACRMFGMMMKQQLFQGKVSFEDATCIKPIKLRQCITTDLMGPKPHHNAFYILNNRIAGRKFYFHSQNGIKTSRFKTKYNHYVTPLDKDSVFEFTVKFKNLTDDELQVLLYAITLEPNMRHKIGFAKPLGFGSVHVTINYLNLIDFHSRYVSTNHGVTEYRDDELLQFIRSKTAYYIENRRSDTLNQLRRIWRWNPADQTNYRYPDTDWFRRNPTAPILETP